MRLTATALLPVALITAACTATSAAEDGAGMIESTIAPPSYSAESRATPAPKPTPTTPPRPSASPGFASRQAARVVSSVKTKKKVVFLTIDDGIDPDPRLLDFFEKRDIPVTVFLTTATVTDWKYWRKIAPSASIQNHTVSHPELPPLGQAGAAAQICTSNKLIAKRTGQIPWMLRPPYGAYNSSTAAAAGDCGLDWLVMWSVSLPGNELRYQTAEQKLKPGDIILTHFRPDLLKSLKRALRDIESQGFEVARLEDYLKPRKWRSPKPKPTQTPSPSIGLASMTNE